MSLEQALRYFEETKDNIIKQLIRLDQVAEQMILEHLSKRILDTINSLRREQFEIIVVGEFSNGKSTFINALLQKNVLPSSQKPTTVVLNKIYYDNKEKYELHFRGDKLSPSFVDEATFKKIVAPDEYDEGLSSINENKIVKSISHIEIGYPSPLLKNNIVIIDSPGTNDLDPARETITNHYIPKSDAAIMVLNATAPLSQTDIELLLNRILAADIHKVFFIINFKDLIRTEKERDKIVEHIEAGLKKYIADPKVFLVSARHALLQRQINNGEEVKISRRRPLLSMEETGFTQFEDKLLNFLQYERGATKLENPIIRGVNLSNEIIENHIQFNRFSLSNNISNLKEEVENLKNQLHEIKRIGERKTKNVYLTLIQKGSVIKSWYEFELEKIADKAEKILKKKYYIGCDVNNVKRSIELEIAPLEKDLNEKFTKKIEDIITDVVKVESKEIEDLISKFNNELEVILTGDVIDIRNNFSILSSDMVIFLNNLSLLIPVIVISAVVEFLENVYDTVKSIFTKEDLILKKLSKAVKNRFRDANLKKVRSLESGWSKLSTKVSGKFEEMIKGQISEKENQIGVLIENNKLSAKQVEEKIIKLDDYEKEIKSIIHELENCQINIQSWCKV